MQHRDLIQDQIEQLSKALAYALERVLNKRSNGNVSQAIEASNQYLKSQVDLDIDMITQLPMEKLKTYIAQRHLNTFHLETLSDYLVELGKNKSLSSPHNGRHYFERAKQLLQIADEMNNSVSIERIEKRGVLKKILENLQ